MLVLQIKVVKKFHNFKSSIPIVVHLYKVRELANKPSNLARYAALLLISNQKFSSNLEFNFYKSVDARFDKELTFSMKY